MDRLQSKLNAYRPLTPGEHAVLDALVTPPRSYPRGAVVRVEGGRPDGVYVIVDGMAQSHKSLSAGGQQILALHVRGDVVGLSSILSGQAVHGLRALTALTVSHVGKDALQDLIAEHPALAQLLWRDMVRDAGISEEWMLSMGRRSAYARCAHFMCEFYLRQAAVGTASTAGCAFPLNQIELADLLGLSVVHINRVLQRLRTDGLAAVKHGRLTIQGWSGLVQAAGFDATYLAPFIPSSVPA